MAAALSSSFLASPTSTKFSRTLPSQFYNPLPLPSSVPPLSSSRSISRKMYKVRAASLKEKDEEVIVEGSFRARTPLDNERKEVDAEQSEPGAVEGWVIKFEQSVNVLLIMESTEFFSLTTKIPAPRDVNELVIGTLDTVIKILDAFYHDRHYARFFVLETIARVPYFSFISVLHMYESFGWWRRADYLKVHFAESWNELHHLLIMEELGGNSLWFDRFLAQHIAIFYYFMIVFMYALSPRMAYHFSECVEKHAYETYDKFLKLRGDELKNLPAPEIAVKYYMNEDLYLFDEFQTARTPNTRRPKIENLYDVFVNVRDDELEHCKTMKACQTHGNLRSPHSSLQEDDDSGCSVSEIDCEGFVDCVKKSLTSRG